MKASIKTATGLSVDIEGTMTEIRDFLNALDNKDSAGQAKKHYGDAKPTKKKYLKGVTKAQRKYARITQDDIDQIYILRAQGFAFKAIAKKVKRTPAATFNIYARTKEGKYKPTPSAVKFAQDGEGN